MSSTAPNVLAEFFALVGKEPECPKCKSAGKAPIPSRGTYRCRGCRRQFSATSHTIFRSQKMGLNKCISAALLLRDGAGPTEIAKAVGIQYVAASKLRAKYVNAGRQFLSIHPNHQTRG